MDDGSSYCDAQAKAQSAMSAYVPLAAKIFGSPRICEPLKMSFLWSLVLSRLLFNAHVVGPTAKYMKVLNVVYMRVLRRICNECRYGEKTIRDIEVRKKLLAPSMDCLLMRGRLRYLSRIVKGSPKALLCLLFSTPGNKKLPWTLRIVEDMRTLRHRVSICSRLPDPADDSKLWVDFIKQYHERWSLAVSTLL